MHENVFEERMSYLLSAPLLLLPFFEVPLYTPEVLWLHVGAVRWGH